MKKSQVIILIVVLLATGVVAGAFFNFSRRSSAETDPSVQNSLAESASTLVKGFEFSGATPLTEGDTFPVLTYPVLQSSAPDWSKPSVVTLGTSFSDSALEFYNQLQGRDIQKIHILSFGLYTQEQLTKFPADVVILDGTDGIAGRNGFNPSNSLNEALGVSAMTSAYLLNGDRTILYAQVNNAEFAGLVGAVNEFLEDGVASVKPNSQALLPVHQALPLTVLPQNLQAELQTELAKPTTLVFLSDKSWCDTCRTWLSSAKAKVFIEEWRDKGYGLVLVEGGADTFAVDRLDNGILEVSDVTVPATADSSPETAPKSALMTSWGVWTAPNTLILRNGELQGKVSWLEAEIDGVPYRDIHFQAVDDITASLDN